MILADGDVVEFTCDARKDGSMLMKEKKVWGFLYVCMFSRLFSNCAMNRKFQFYLNEEVEGKDDKIR